MMKLEVAYVFDDSASRVEGLQGKTIDDGECALFVYDSPRYVKFHMGTVGYDLWLSTISGGKVSDSMFMEFGSTDVYSPSGRTALVVESLVPLEVGAEADIIDGKLVVG